MPVFSEASIKLVTKLKPDAIKIPSGESITYYYLVN